MPAPDRRLADPRIAMFIHRIDERAIAGIVIRVCEWLAREGVDVTLFATAADPRPRRGISGDVRVDVLGSLVDRTTFAVPRLVRALRRARADVLFAHGNGPNRAAVLAREISEVDTRVVTVDHNHYSTYISPSGGGYSYRRLRNLLTGLLYARADCVAGVAPGIVEDLVGRFGGEAWETRVLPDPGRDPEEIARLSAEPLDHPWYRRDREHRLVCSVANVIPRKGVHVLVEALPGIRERAGDVRLVVVGRTDNPVYLDTVKRAATERGVGESVSFVGFRENPLPWMAGADAFALTSLNEGCPRVLSEAMACGTPVVAADCPTGPAFILEEARAGLLVPVADAPATAEAIASVLLDDELREELVRKGRERARHFTPRRVAEAYLDAARHVVRGRRSTGPRPG
ncbi:MAG: glycosyltransferase [Gemmatimonadetes bacterium]|nr:glycosyltransferase [Gemmatimonadota bacterium]